MNIELKIICKHDENILKNLFEYYSYDFSKYYNYDLNDNGKFDKVNVEKYFDKSIYQVYLIKVDKKYAGFIIAKKEEKFNCVNEFWIMPKYRKGFFAYNVLKQFSQYMYGFWIFGILNNNDRWTKALECMIKRNDDICKIMLKRNVVYKLDWGDYEFTEFLLDCKKK